MPSSRGLRIWIDLANSPHVQFFKPVISDLLSRGHEVVLTARDFAQTLELLDEAGMDHVVVGRHGGRGVTGKALAVASRAIALAKFARAQRVDLALHHNSYAQALAAWACRIPSVTLMDYEHQPANWISFTLATKVMMPAAIPAEALAKYRMGRKLVRYDGLKEDVYLHGLAAACSPYALAKLEIPEDKVLAVFRPPPDTAMYHRFENPLCDDLLDYLADQPHVLTLVSPRTKVQADRLACRECATVRILRSPVDGPALLLRADLVISAGGTMAREAAVLGVPAYTVFCGRRAGVDAQLIREDRLVPIDSREDFARLNLATLNRTQRTRDRGALLRTELVTEILSTLTTQG